MRVLIVGNQGQVARELAIKLAVAGYDFVALGRPALDLASPASVVRAIEDYGPDAIINAAAYTAVDRAEDEPEIANAVNGHGIGVLGRAAGDIPLIHYSTDYVFDGTKTIPYLETDPTHPIGAYGASKLLGEQKLFAAHPRSVVLRTSWVCSAHGNNFVKTMLRLGGERSDVSVVDDQYGGPTFADHLADAAIALLPRLLAAKQDDAQFGIFHFSGAPDCTWYGFAKAIFEGAAARGVSAPHLHPITTDQYPTRAKRPANSRLDCGKIERIHGLKRPDWHAGLSRCLDQLIGAETP